MKRMMKIRMKTKVVLTVLLLALGVTEIANAGNRKSAIAEWQSIQAGSNRAENEEAFFERWAQSDPKTLLKVARTFFDDLIRHKQKHKRDYLIQLSENNARQGHRLLHLIEAMHADGISFHGALDTILQGSVEIVLTSHPTQIQSVSYRLLWQLHERLNDAQSALEQGDEDSAVIYAYSAHRIGLELANKGILGWNERTSDLSQASSRGAVIARWHTEWTPLVDQKLKVLHPGNPGKLTVEEEARETADVYLPNIYWALPKVRNVLTEGMKKFYGSNEDYSAERVEAVAKTLVKLSSWAWDADGKAMVKADTMLISDGIQQSAIFKLHHQRLEMICDSLKTANVRSEQFKNLLDRVQRLRGVLAEHSQTLEKNPYSTEIIAKLGTQNTTLEVPAVYSPSILVRNALVKEVSSILTLIGTIPSGAEFQASPILRSLEDLKFAIESFQVNNHVRQNIEMVHKALAGRDQKTAVYDTEIQRLGVLAQDPGKNGAFITADTKTAADTDAALQLLEVANLTGKVRYFPLIENMESFRQLPQLVEYWLSPGSAMRRHILERSKLTSEPPTLNVMFALSDTNRLGSQAASHLMEMMGAEAHVAVNQMSVKFPISEDELGGSSKATFQLKIFWGGGSQLARGGDWISHEKTIYTDQGNARDLKYDSSEMAAVRMDLHSANGVKQAFKAKSEPSVGQMQSASKDAEELFRLIRQRESEFHHLFFDSSGHRNVLEAYLLFGSMLNEARSNSYGARPTSRIENAGPGAAPAHRLSDRFFAHTSAGRSLEDLIEEKGLATALKLPLKKVWEELRPNTPYSPPSIDQRAITVDNTFSETKFNQLARSVEAEEALGITAETSVKWLQSDEAHFRSYRRQKVAEVLATSLVNLDSHASRLPKSLRAMIHEESANRLIRESRGKTADEVTLEDLVGIFAYIHQTIEKVEKRNHQIAQILARGSFNPLSGAKNYVESPLIAHQRPLVRFGQALLSWIHRNSTFGSDSSAPRDLRALFPTLYEDKEGISATGIAQSSDALNQLEFLAWAIHYEGQQHHLQVNELNGTVEAE